MLDLLYLKTLTVESLSPHNLGKLYQITEMEQTSSNCAEQEVLQLMRRVVSEEIKTDLIENPAPRSSLTRA